MISLRFPLCNNRKSQILKSGYLNLTTRFQGFLIVFFKKNTFWGKFVGCKLLCFRVIFIGWECSHSIRSEILLRYWCSKNFLNFFKNIFFDRSKKNPKKFLIFVEKIFFGKVDFFFEYQYRCKSSLRIEWEHSQPLKITLKHSNFVSKWKKMFWFHYFVANCTHKHMISLVLGP